MIPYVLSPGSHLPLASFSSNYFSSFFEEWRGEDRNRPNAKYLVFFYINDIWQLERANYAKRPEAATLPYILDRVISFCGSDLRHGRCSLVLDMSGEGHPYNHESFIDLHDWCAAEGVSPRNVVLISQNRILGADYHKVFSHLSEKVRCFIYDEFIAGLALYMADNDSAFERRFGFSKLARVAVDPKIEMKKFLCLNATPRPIRLCVLAAMDFKGILEDTLWSLLKEDSGKGSVDPSQVLKLLSRFDLAEAFPCAERLLASPPKILDRLSVKQSNNLIYTMDISCYNDTFMSVVTETDFGSGEVTRITEKTIKSFAMGHPVVVFGNPSSLSLVREFGFSTFSPVIDESYDLMMDPIKRFNAVLEQVVALRLKLDDKDSIERQQLTEIGRGNLDHALSGNFRKRYEEMVEIPLVDELRSLASSS